MIKGKKSNTSGIIIRTKKRVALVCTALLLFSVFLIYNLATLSVTMNEHYRSKVFDQITTTSSMKASRGKIYDANMNVLAESKTVWRIFVSTRDIALKSEEDGIAYASIISKGLSDILGLDYDTLYSKINRSSILDVTVKKSATDDEYKRTLDFAKKQKLEGLILFEAQSSRYYPEGTLAAHVLGFSGSDNQGLFGLEYYYNEYLSGKDGYYLYARDANGNALPGGYVSYTPPTEGASLVTTIDSYVQTVLEEQLEEAVKTHGVTNRATGIVMDVNTGAILAMATSSPFDPNSPYTLDAISLEKLNTSGLEKDSEEYKKYKKELLEVMWSNKAISETYEPGSTFKIVTVSAALDTGAANINDTFSCHGYHTVGGWRIKCHKVTGHGSGFTLAYGLQMSCNPTMMQIAERIGSEKFYEYVEKFGYLEKCGIDLPGEAGTIFHKENAIGSTELATASFGQRFKVSVINHLTAISAVANGGQLVTPYLVDKIIDSKGNTIYQHETEIRREVISRDIASLVSNVLEGGVSGEGGAKNARVEGYKIAAKTGTSQKFDILDENGNSYLRIGSTVAYNIDDEGGIATIIVIDEPQGQVKYGSVVAAPYVGALMAKILPYLDYKSSVNYEEINVPDLVGLNVNSAIKILKEKGIEYEVIGDGDLVLSHTPTSDEKITSKNTKIFLLTTDESTEITVPSLVGLDVSKAADICIALGLNLKITGSVDGGIIIYQSLPAGAKVKKGHAIDLKAQIIDFED